MSQRSVWIIIFSLFPTGLIGQIGQPSFAEYLIKQGAYRDVLDLESFVNAGLSKSQLDSMSFYSAWAHFHLREIPEAIDRFSEISSPSSFYEQSRIFSSWCNLYQGNSIAAQSVLLEGNQESKANSKEVFRLQQAAIYLYDKDFNKAREELNIIKSNVPRYEEQVDHLEKLMQNGLSYKPRSKGTAALLSGLIPGAGKVYAGELGAGISTFLVMAGIGGVAAENIIKSGWLSWNSLLFTGIFGAFYLGNIYGSMISIQTYRSRFNENYHQGILATVIIPLRDYYR